jgi:hypothetical protein
MGVFGAGCDEWWVDGMSGVGARRAITRKGKMAT